MTLERLTQPDWCNDPQPWNWGNACMRAPRHEGDHAVRKGYRPSEAFFWPSKDGPVRWCSADQFPDLWQPRLVEPGAEWWGHLAPSGRAGIRP